ncbi:hypothetical protein JYU34_006320 [Plutella xylostella]|uniref:BTB domain-containing protein n=1 Tax=Plutella xylostella TaxID=51655 RepID=A0ABQ7QRT5_PLUXY|nr:hypothetical protein JYU34_006320 [Plutella xylostella]
MDQSKVKVYLINYIQKGNCFSARMKLKLDCEEDHREVMAMSPEYIVCSIAILKVKVGITTYSKYGSRESRIHIINVSFGFSKRIKDCLNCMLYLQINKSSLTIISTECSGGFIQAPESYSLSDLRSGNVNVAGVIDIFMVPNPCSVLYDDKDLIDFSLKGIDGSVDFHRHIMAISSPVLKAMLAGPWREAKQGVLDLKDVNISTIQHLKDYIYLNKVPETERGLGELIKLAHFLLMTTLVKICVFNILIRCWKLENVVHWIHFAGANNISEMIPWLLDIGNRSEATLGITDIITSYDLTNISEGDDDIYKEENMPDAS